MHSEMGGMPKKENGGASTAEGKERSVVGGKNSAERKEVQERGEKRNPAEKLGPGMWGHLKLLGSTGPKRFGAS